MRRRLFAKVKVSLLSERSSILIYMLWNLKLHLIQKRYYEKSRKFRAESSGMVMGKSNLSN